MRPDTPQKYENILIEDVTGNAASVLYIKPWTQFFDLKGEKDIRLSYAKNIVFRNVKLDCEIFFDVNNSDQYVLSDFTFENVKINASKKPEINRSYINNFVLKNVVINGQSIK
jgi:hypothetical protein